MSEAMTLDRFQELADAYGGVVARWPMPVRDAAFAMASQPAAIAILAGASTLDDALDAWIVPVPSDALRAKVVADAPAPTRDWTRRARIGWSGIGIAAALAGAVSGSAAVAIVAPLEALAGGSTSFGDIGAQEIDR